MFFAKILIVIKYWSCIRLIWLRIYVNLFSNIVST